MSAVQTSQSLLTLTFFSLISVPCCYCCTLGKYDTSKREPDRLKSRLHQCSSHYPSRVSKDQSQDKAVPSCQASNEMFLCLVLGSKEMWEPGYHDTLVLPQTIWQQPPGPEPYRPIVSSNPGSVSCIQSDKRATTQHDPIPEPTEKPPTTKRQKFSRQQHSLGSHKIAVVSDQLFMVLYPSRANFTREIEHQQGAIPSPRVVNAVDEYTDSRVRDFELHAEWWLECHRGVGDNDVVLLAMNLFGDKQYDFDIYGCKFSVIARPGSVQVVSMKERPLKDGSDCVEDRDGLFVW